MVIVIGSQLLQLQDSLRVQSSSDDLLPIIRLEVGTFADDHTMSNSLHNTLANELVCPCL